MAQVARWLDGSFLVLYALLSFEIVVELLGASEDTPFHPVVERATAPFFAPFEELFHGPAHGQPRLVFSYLMGLIAYTVLHVATQGLLDAVAPRRGPSWRMRARAR